MPKLRFFRTSEQDSIADQSCAKVQYKEAFQVSYRSLLNSRLLHLRWYNEKVGDEVDKEESLHKIVINDLRVAVVNCEALIQRYLEKIHLKLHEEQYAQQRFGRLHPTRVQSEQVPGQIFLLLAEFILRLRALFELFLRELQQILILYLFLGPLDKLHLVDIEPDLFPQVVYPLLLLLFAHLTEFLPPLRLFLDFGGALQGGFLPVPEHLNLLFFQRFRVFGFAMVESLELLLDQTIGLLTLELLLS